MSSGSAGGRPFSTFEVTPFLWATPEDEKRLHARYRELNLKFHPDRVPEEEKAMAEALCARISRDYQQLRDLWGRVEAVAELGAEASPSRGAPPALAEAYFDLQEKLVDDPVAGRAALPAFVAEVVSKREAAEKAVMEFARQFPFSGFEKKPAPWRPEDLQKLRALLQELRYYRSFERDIRARFPVD